MPKFQETEQAAKDLIKALEPLVKMMDDLAKSIVSVDSVIKKQAKTTEDLTDKEKELKRQAELISQAEKTAAKAHDLTTEAGKRLTKEQIKLAEAKKLVAEEVKKSLGLSKQEQQEAKKLAQETAKLAKEQDKAAKEKQKADNIAFKNSKEGIKLSLQEKIAKKALIKEAEKELGITKQSTGFMNNLTGAVKSGITQFGLMFGAIGLGIGTIKKFGTALINSSDVMQDKFEKAMTVAKFASDRFFKSLGQEGISGFLSNLKQIVSEAKTYAEIIDQIQDRTRSLRIAESEMNVLKQKQLQILRDVTKSDEERIAAADNIINMENDLAATRIKIAEQAYNARIDAYADLGISKEMIKTQMNEYEINRDKILAADKYNEALETIFKAESGNFAIIKRQSEAYKNAIMTIENYSEKDKLFAQERAKYGKLSAEQLDEIANLQIEYNNAVASGDEATQRTLARKNSLINEYIVSQEKEKEQVEKTAITKEVAYEREKLYIDEINLKMIEQGEILNQTVQENEDKQIASLGKIHEQWRKNLFERKELTKEEEEEREKILENVKLGLESGAKLESLLTEKKMQDLDAEMNKIQYNRDKEIAAAEKAGKDTSRIKEKYQKQENKLKEKQWKTEHRHAIVQSIINTALAVTALLANPPAAIAAGILGAIETGIIASQEMPKFKEGTKGKLKKATFAEIGDGYKRELVVTPDGSYLSDNKPTKAFLPEGSQVFSGEKTEQMMKENGLSDSLLSQIIVEERLTRKALLDRPEVHNSITSHGMIKYMKIRNMVIHSLKERFS